MPDFIGKSFGRYHILEQLGEGGMATVFKAYDTRLERDAAVKIIRRDVFPPNQLENILKRFEREAKALARLAHPNIVSVIDYGEEDGTPYLVMVYFPGGTLKQRLGKPFPWQDAVRMLLPIARALQFAHSQNIVHRDVKPSNILITLSGEPMLTDFGIAKILDAGEGQTLTGTGVGVGTPEYMAPEQWTGHANPLSDIYSLGVVFYELVTGHKPYVADTPAAVLLKQNNDPLPRPSQYVPDLPEAVEKLLFKALAKNPEDRYPEMGAMVAALESALASGGLGVQPRSLAEKTTSNPVPLSAKEPPTAVVQEARRKVERTISPRLPARRSKLLPFVIGAVAILLLAGGIFGTNYFILHKPARTNNTPALDITPTLAKTTSTEVEVFSIWVTSTGAAPLGAMVEVFNQQYPNIKFVNATDAIGVGVDPNSVLDARLAAGNPPDSWQAIAGQKTIASYVAAGQLRPLDDLFTTTSLEKVLPKTLIQLISKDGHPYSVPVSINRMNVLWYNPEVLSAVGVTANPKTDFKTLDDFFAVCDEIKAAGRTCLALGQSWMGWYLFENIMIGTMGADRWNGLWTTPPANDWNGPEVAQGIANFAKVLSYTNANASDLSDWQSASKMVADGEAAFNCMGGWAYDYFTNPDPNGLALKPHRDFDWAVSPGTYGIFSFSSDGFVLPVGARHPDAALAWLNVVASRAGQEAVNPLTGTICARTDCNQSLFSEYLQDSARDWTSNFLVGSFFGGVVAAPSWATDIFNAISLFQADTARTAEFQAALVDACKKNGNCK